MDAGKLAFLRRVSREILTDPEALANIEKIRQPALYGTPEEITAIIERHAIEKISEARRKQIRAENQPESAMNALFREEQGYTTRLFASQRHAGAVGAFRGANYDAQAYYRSQLDCVMFTRNVVPFCRVCQRALEQVIDLYAGPHRTD